MGQWNHNGICRSIPLGSKIINVTQNNESSKSSKIMGHYVTKNSEPSMSPRETGQTVGWKLLGQSWLASIRPTWNSSWSWTRAGKRGSLLLLISRPMTGIPQPSKEKKIYFGQCLQRPMFQMWAKSSMSPMKEDLLAPISPKFLLLYWCRTNTKKLCISLAWKNWILFQVVYKCPISFVSNALKEKESHLALPRRQLSPQGSPPPRCWSGRRQARSWRAPTRRWRGGAAFSALPPFLKKKISPHQCQSPTGPKEGPTDCLLIGSCVLPLPSLPNHWPGPPSVGRRLGHGRGAVQTDRTREKGRSQWLIRSWPASKTFSRRWNFSDVCPRVSYILMGLHASLVVY